MIEVEELKLKLESAELPETEVIIRGDVTSDEVVSLLQLLKKRNTFIDWMNGKVSR